MCEMKSGARTGRDRPALPVVSRFGRNAAGNDGCACGAARVQCLPGKHRTRLGTVFLAENSASLFRGDVLRRAGFYPGRKIFFFAWSKKQSGKLRSVRGEFLRLKRGISLGLCRIFSLISEIVQALFLARRNRLTPLRLIVAFRFQRQLFSRKSKSVFPPLFRSDEHEKRDRIRQKIREIITAADLAIVEDSGAKSPPLFSGFARSGRPENLAHCVWKICGFRFSGTLPDG